jgi:TRAP-type C4-dicarboxylate transport system permease small subunit
VTRALRAAERLLDALAVLLFLVMFGLVLAQVVCRYLLNDPLVWSEELARYLFVWVAFLGWTVAARRDRHIAVTMLRDRLPSAGARWMALLGEAAVALFAVVLAREGLAMTARSWNVPSVTLPVGFAVVYLAVPVAAAVVLLASLGRIAALARRR